MARWQLTEPHYLRVPGNKWEMQTQDRATGRPNRRQFDVPLHLDPNIESDWNYREQIGQNVIDGKIIVCHEGKGEPKDIIFVGDPTPGMLPLDDEARAISAKFSWVPTQGLDELSQANSFQQQLLVSLSAMQDKVATAPQIAGMAEFMKSMSDMMAMQTQLLSAILRNGEAPLVYDPTQHVVDDEVPLEEPEAPTEADLAEAAAVQAHREKLRQANDAHIRSGARRI